MKKIELFTHYGTPSSIMSNIYVPLFTILERAIKHGLYPKRGKMKTREIDDKIILLYIYKCTLKSTPVALLTLRQELDKIDKSGEIASLENLFTDKFPKKLIKNKLKYLCKERLIEITGYVRINRPGTISNNKPLTYKKIDKYAITPKGLMKIINEYYDGVLPEINSELNKIFVEYFEQNDKLF